MSRSLKQFPCRAIRSGKPYLLAAILITAHTSSLPVAFAQGKNELRASHTLHRLSDDPSLGDGLLSTLSGAAITAGEENNLASFRIATSNGSRSYSLTVSSPTDTSQGFTNLANLDGLAGALTATVSFSKTIPPPIAQAAKAGIETALTTLCDRLGLDPSKGQCSHDHVQAAGTHTELKEWAWTTLGEHRTPIWNVEAKVGRQTFQFFDSVTPDPTKSTEIPYSVAVGYGSVGGKSLLSAKLRYEKSFVNAPDATLCTPLLNGDGQDRGLDTCQTLPDGGPQERDAAILALEGRFFFHHTAVSPIASYDFENDVAGLALPWYFLRGKPKDGQPRQFTGGIRLGWRSDQDDVTASVFISRALSRTKL